MVNINKKLEQLEKIKEEIALEKKRIEQEFGKEIITVLDLDYDQLTKKEIKKLADQIKNMFKKTIEPPFQNNNGHE